MFYHLGDKGLVERGRTLSGQDRTGQDHPCLPSYLTEILFSKAFVLL